MRTSQITVLSLALGLSTASARAQSKRIQALSQQQKAANAALVRSQAKINQDSEQAQSMVEEYRALSESLIALRAQNAQLARVLQEQSGELASLESQVAQVAKVRVKLSPLLTRMLQALDDFVALDLPFLSSERKARSEELHRLLQEGNAPVATQARRLFEAYMVELGYGQTLEAYEDQIELQGQPQAVQLLRVGRVGLYYLSLDDTRAGRYNPQTKRFEALDASFVPGIKKAIQVANKRVPPQLIEIPVARSSSTAPGVRS